MFFNYRSLHADLTSELEQEGEEESGKKDSLIEDNSGVPNSPNASLYNQTNIPAKQGEDKSDDSDTDFDDSDTDSDEDCDKHENVFTHDPLDVTTSTAKQDRSSSAIESESITSHCSSSTIEDETDGGPRESKRNSSKRMTLYRLVAVSYL